MATQGNDPIYVFWEELEKQKRYGIWTTNPRIHSDEQNPLSFLVMLKEERKVKTSMIWGKSRQTHIGTEIYKDKT